MAARYSTSFAVKGARAGITARLSLFLPPVVTSVFSSRRERGGNGGGVEAGGANEGAYIDEGACPPLDRLVGAFLSFEEVDEIEAAELVEPGTGPTMPQLAHSYSNQPRI